MCVEMSELVWLVTLLVEPLWLLNRGEPSYLGTLVEKCSVNCYVSTES